MSQALVCDRCNSVLDASGQVVVTCLASDLNGIPPLTHGLNGVPSVAVKHLCVSCSKELTNFFATQPTWKIPAPTVTPLQGGIPSTLG